LIPCALTGTACLLHYLESCGKYTTSHIASLIGLGDSYWLDERIIFIFPALVIFFRFSRQLAHKTTLALMVPPLVALAPEPITGRDMKKLPDKGPLPSATRTHGRGSFLRLISSPHFIALTVDLMETRMKRIAIIVLTILISGIHTIGYAANCNCNDWMEKGGYCVDYIKTRIPTFPIPNRDEMVGLKNTGIYDVTEGDVAVFFNKNYWHVAFVEKVYRDQRGKATAINVSEMNFGDALSLPEFKAKWKSNSPAELNRSFCCGITDNYDQITLRDKITLNTVKQIWSPDDVASEGIGRRRVKAIVGKVREVVNRFFEFSESSL